MEIVLKFPHFLLFSNDLANRSSKSGTRSDEVLRGSISYISFISKGLRQPLYIKGSK